MYKYIKALSVNNLFGTNLTDVDTTFPDNKFMELFKNRYFQYMIALI